MEASSNLSTERCTCALRSLALSLGTALSAAASVAAQNPPQAPPPAPAISSFSLGLPISWDECRTRVSRALEAEGFTGLRDFGNGWEAWARGGAVSIACLAGSSQTILTIVTTGPAPFDLIAERTRLLNRIRVDGAAPPPRTATPLGEGWNLNASRVRGQNRERFSVTCPAGGNQRAAWGTDLYTDDSSICTAAVHAGVITTRAGGTVTIEVRPGEGSYRGGSRNGVTTEDFGPYEGSFMIVRPTAAVATATGGAGWNATAARHRGRIGERFSFTCPPAGIAGGVWGTDTYTDESSVCAAAVHAGLLSLVTGGRVSIEMRPGAASYEGSTRRGVASASFGAGQGSFVFVR